MTKEEIKNKLEEDINWTLPDDANDEDWDMYLEVKDEMTGGAVAKDSWEDEEETEEEEI